jgi:peptidoglycan/LPS O-acetylase OafA/YrhL
MVCVGHATNFAGIGRTFIPNDGVLLFFVLSGFLIAFTLDTKSRSADYTIIQFGIERASRICTAYLPALLLIGVATLVVEATGIKLTGDPTDLRTFIGNLTMRQNLPSDWGVSTFGTAGHLTSVAVEFHIYFFVGALYFILVGRNRFLCVAIAILFSTMPLGYFAAMPGSDRSLFLLWLLGFASYFVVKSVSEFRSAATFAFAAFIACTLIWLLQRTPGDDYNPRQYPMLILSFSSLVLFSQSMKIVSKPLASLITFFADYSFSLFLIHLTTIRILYALLPDATITRTLLAVAAANLLAIGFSMLFEQHYRQVALAVKNAVKRTTIPAAVLAMRDIVSRGREGNHRESSNHNPSRPSADSIL